MSFSFFVFVALRFYLRLFSSFYAFAPSFVAPTSAFRFIFFSGPPLDYFSLRARFFHVFFSVAQIAFDVMP